MTTELADCMSNLGLSETDQSVSESYFRTVRGIDRMVRTKPSPTYSGQQPYTHAIAHCSRIDPVRYSPMSPPLIDQHTNYALQTYNYNEPLADHWANNPHITGLGVSLGGRCGQPNEVGHSGCVISGKSFAAIKEFGKYPHP